MPKFDAPIDMDGNLIERLADPQSDTDAVNKRFEAIAIAIAIAAEVERATTALDAQTAGLARTIDLGTAAYANTGTGPTDVVLGNDPRLVNQEFNGTIDGAQITSGKVSEVFIDDAIARDAEVDTKVALEATARDTAISNATATEVTARNTAIGSGIATHVALPDPHAQYQKETDKDQVGGYVGLDGAGKINSAFLPSLSGANTFFVADQAAMLALSAVAGDRAVRADLSNAEFILVDPGVASVLANWKQLTSGATVVSVNGQTGVVTISTDAAAGTGSLRTLGTGAQQAAPGTSIAAEVSARNAAIASSISAIRFVPDPLQFYKSGTVVVTVSLGRWTVPPTWPNITLGYVLLDCNQALPPLGGTLSIDVLLNGTTVFTTTANLPKLTTGQFHSQSAAPDITVFAPDDVLTVAILAPLPPTFPGSDLLIRPVFV